MPCVPLFHEHLNVNTRISSPLCRQRGAPHLGDGNGFPRMLVKSDQHSLRVCNRAHGISLQRFHIVGHRETLRPDCRDAGADLHTIAESDRRPVVYGMPRDHHPCRMPVPLPAHEFAEELDPGLLEIGKEGGVVDDAHGVDVGKSHFRSVRCHGREDTFAA